MKTKTCTRCGRNALEREFCFRNRRKGIRLSYCNQCSRRYTKDHYRRNIDVYKERNRRRQMRIKTELRGLILDYLKGHPCVDCGESDPVVLEFDHVRGRKKNVVSYMIRSAYLPSAVFEEISKCDVRCANCHRRRTAKQNGWFRRP